jgi:hypothetical protein
MIHMVQMVGRLKWCGQQDLWLGNKPTPTEQQRCYLTHELTESVSTKRRGLILEPGFAIIAFVYP